MNKEIYVFGSNREGRHGQGAALEARRRHGAVYGQAEGMRGSSYAIVTKELREGFPPVTLLEVEEGVKKFLAYAKDHPSLTFAVTTIGCGLARFTLDQIAPLFQGSPENVMLPEVFTEILNKGG